MASDARFLLDTNVLLYARGAEHRYRDPCRAVLANAASGAIELMASVEVVQEYAHVLLRRGLDRASVSTEASRVRHLCEVLPFDTEIVPVMLHLIASTPLGVRDAVHAATALRHGGLPVISTDLAFDEVPGLRRVDPVDV